jgi:hypothetical protein
MITRRESVGKPSEGTRCVEIPKGLATARLTAPAAPPVRVHDTVRGDDTGALTVVPSGAFLLPLAVHDAPAPAPRPAEMAWETGLFRLAVAPDGRDRDQAYALLSSAVHHFLTERLESVTLDTLRSASGVLRRVGGWALGDLYNVSVRYHAECLANVFQAWHQFREMSRAVDTRHDLIVRMRGRSDGLIMGSLFNEEGRTILASRVRGFVAACSRVGLRTAALRRCEWIAAVLTYRTGDGAWQASPSECLRLCTNLLRELGDDATLHALRGVALTAWNGLTMETNYLRDVFRPIDEGADAASLFAEIDERFEALRRPGFADVVYFPGDYAFADGRERRSPRTRFVF